MFAVSVTSTCTPSALDIRIANLERDNDVYHKHYMNATDSDEKSRILKTICLTTKILAMLMKEESTGLKSLCDVIIDAIIVVYGLEINHGSLEEILQAGGVPSPKGSIITKMKQYFADQVTLVLSTGDSNLAVDVYRRAHFLPGPADIDRLLQSGISVVGRCKWAYQAVVLFGHRGHVPVALKLLTNEFEVESLKYLCTLSIDCPTIIKFELVDNSRYLLMPRLVSNLVELGPLHEISQVSFCNDMVSAVEYLHNLRLAHMDVKPANVGIDEAGRFILIDIGNAAVFGKETTITDLFLPLDYAIRNGQSTARAEADFALIAVTLLLNLAPSYQLHLRMTVALIFEHLRCAGCAESVVRVLLRNTVSAVLEDCIA